MKVAVLIPSVGRAQQMAGNVAGLLETIVPKGIELVVMVAYQRHDAETAEAAQALGVMLVEREPGTTAVEGWNLAYQRTDADWYVLGADDIRWHPSWLIEAVDVASRPGVQVVGLNDLHTNLEAYAPHYMASRAFCERELGGHIAPPDYLSWWFDREVCERAQAMGAYAPAPKAIAEHLHPDWNTAEMDETYTAAWNLHDVDQKRYAQRRV